MLSISGLLIVDPMSFNDLCASSLTYGCVSEIALEILVTMSGNLLDTYLGLQYAIVPNAQILATLPLH